MTVLSDGATQAAGKVFLVGAGPGDPDLITLRGQRLLGQADCVVYDKLIHPRLLNLVPAHAQRIYVGKQAGSAEHATPQEFINDVLIDHARQGQRVVRLKGGDPLLFARGGEEASALREAGIAYEIVPGVTAALAAAATAGLPLTDRQLASAVAFVTGHEKPGKEHLINWADLAKFPGTLVIYMGLTRTADIAKALFQHGKDGLTPVTFVEWAGTNRQRVHQTTLAQATAGPPAELQSPVISIIGPVGKLRDKLEWFEERPLFGHGVLVTRPSHQAGDTVEQLEDLGAEVFTQPAFEITPPPSWDDVDRWIEQLNRVDWLVFSSRNGVRMFLDRLWRADRDWRVLGRLKIATIGPGTAETLAEYHLRPDIMPDTYRAEEFADALEPMVAGQRVLLVRANRGRDVLPTRLQLAGAKVSTVVAYHQQDVEKLEPSIQRALVEGKIQWILFSSQKMAAGILDQLGPDLAQAVREQVGLITLSPVTSQAVRACGFDVAGEAKVFTMDGLLTCLQETVAQQGQGVSLISAR